MHLADLCYLSAFAAQEQLSYSFMGRLSNTLVVDTGYNGLGIKSDNLNYIKCNGQELTLGAGVSINELIQACILHELTGLESLAGIPASVGGAVYMNAGAYNSTIGERVTEALCFDMATASVKEYGSSQLTFGYRQSSFLDKEMILQVKLKLEKGSRQAIINKVEYTKEKRKKAHPSRPSLGCAFKRAAGEGSGRLIDLLGLKGTRVGDAMISYEHAGFIVNMGKGTAGDYLELAGLVQNRVLQSYGIELKREIKILGGLDL